MIGPSLLSGILIGALFFGRLPNVVLALLCVIVPVLLIGLHKKEHNHDGFLQLDVLVQGSKLKEWNTGIKVCTVVAMLVFCIGANSFFVSIVVFLSITAVNLGTSQVGVSGYLSLLTIPVTFVVLSGIVLLVDISAVPVGVINLPLFGSYLSITAQNQSDTGLLLIKAVAALSCLYALSLSTPLYEITSFLRRIHVPAIFVELMVLIYRYIFVLLQALNAMTTAANARLGYKNYRNTWRSFGGIAANLMSRSFVRASRNFDAMESRGYDGEIRFLESVKPFKGFQMLLAGIVFCLPVATLVIERWFM